MKSIHSVFVSLIRSTESKGLNLFYASICVIDLFGVFPIVALPAALISCGFYGIPLLVFVISVQLYTAVILGRCWIIAEKLDPSIIDKSRYPYAAVAEMVYGKRMRFVVTFLLNLTVFGAGIPNILVSSQNMQLIGFRISNGNFYFSFCYWLIILGVVLSPVMWLGSPKNMKLICSISVVTVLAVSCLIWACILQGESMTPQQHFQGIKLDEPNYLNLLQVYGMITFQFDIHPMLMTIEVDMTQKHKIGKVVCYGLMVTCLLSIITTTLTAYQYGTAATANVLEILPRSKSLYLAIMLVTLQLCLSSAVGHSALFQHVEDWLKIPKEFNWKRCILRTSIIGLGVLIAEILPKFDLVMGIIGGTLTGPLIFILPPLLYRRICQMESSFDKRKRNDDDDEIMMGNEDGDEDKIKLDALQGSYGTFSRESLSTNGRQPRIFSEHFIDSTLSVFVIVFGVIATLASTYFNLLNFTSFNDFWTPCIYNITNLNVIRDL